MTCIVLSTRCNGYMRAIQEYDIDAESQALLDDGHKEILQSECYEDYGVSSYINR